LWGQRAIVKMGRVGDSGVRFLSLSKPTA